jgi:hypothetical protein
LHMGLITARTEGRFPRPIIDLEHSGFVAY